MLNPYSYRCEALLRRHALATRITYIHTYIHFLQESFHVDYRKKRFFPFQQKKCGCFCRDVPFRCFGEEVDEAEDYEAPGSNPGKEL